MPIVPTHIVAMREHYRREYALMTTTRLEAIRDDLEDELAARPDWAIGSNKDEANGVQRDAVEAELEARELDIHDPHIYPGASI